MNERKPVVSVVIPTYNGSKYIWRAIESVLMQNFSDYEIVISDNSSTDSTKEVVLEYAKRHRGKIKYFRNDKNIGYPANLRKLIYELSQGQYIAILCDDDYYCDQNALSYYVDIMEKNPSAGFAFSRCNVKIEKNEFSMELCYKNNEREEISCDIENGLDFFLNFGEYTKKGYPTLSSLFIRRNVAEKAKIFVENDFKYCPDLIAVQKMLLVSNAARVNKELVIYSWRPSNLSHQFKVTEMFREEVFAVEYMYEFAKENGLAVQKLKVWKRNEKDRHARGKVYHILWEIENGYIDLQTARKIIKNLFFDIVKNSFRTILNPGIISRIVLILLINERGFKTIKAAWKKLKKISKNFNAPEELHE